MSIAIISGTAAVGSLGLGIYGAVQGRKAAKSAREAQLEQLGLAQSQLEAMMAEQQNPAEVFAEILTSFPGLLDQVLPQFSRQSTDLAKKFSADNVGIWKDTLSSMFPDYNRLRGRREAMINEMDPKNLGAAEIAAVTRKLSPLIPEGTIGPKGAVAGGTTSPVSMYRNWISELYQDRRSQFLTASTALQQEDQNSAARQQVKSEAFLPIFLQTAASAAGSLTQQTMSQDQQNVAAQQSMFNTLLGMTANTNYDPSQFTTQIASSIATGISGLAGAYGAFKANGAAPITNTFKSSYPTQSVQPLRSLADRPTPYTGKAII